MSIQFIEFNQEHHVKEGLSGVFHDHLNPVEAGKVCLVKVSLKVLLNMTCAQYWTWFLALKYLADVHNQT